MMSARASKWVPTFVPIHPTDHHAVAPHPPCEAHQHYVHHNFFLPSFLLALCQNSKASFVVQTGFIGIYGLLLLIDITNPQASIKLY
jgi:hypothetical protein